MRPTTFLFSDVQIVNPIQLEDLNSILNSGDVPGAFVCGCVMRSARRSP
jgi:P-loop containing dynein motor region D4